MNEPVQAQHQPELAQFPLVSIVTPSYNALPYIKETIESIWTQDYPAIEHIVIDGGSTDGTKQVLEQNPQIRWISEKDKGQSDALNKGFRLVTGEIIGWLNADDTYRPGAILKAVQYLQSHPDVDLVYTDIQIVDEKNIPIRYVQAAPFSVAALLKKNVVNQPTVFMRRRVLEALRGVDDDIQFYVMDREFWLRAGLSFKLQYLPGEVFANFRFCKGTLSHDNPKAFHKAWVDVLNKFEKTPGLDKKMRAQIRLAKQLAMKQYYFSSSVQEAKNGKKAQAFSDFRMALAIDWMSFFQIGVWKLFVRVFLLNR
jgi:glycosyltransferase involved in cell wall biosynthesis